MERDFFPKLKAAMEKQQAGKADAKAEVVKQFWCILSGRVAIACFFLTAEVFSWEKQRASKALCAARIRR